ncbi:hypothetical protein K458DRAFT_483871, partial [Lentithecium fluviatile CBS 122367]
MAQKLSYRQALCIRKTERFANPLFSYLTSQHFLQHKVSASSQRKLAGISSIPIPTTKPSNLQTLKPQNVFQDTKDVLHPYLWRRQQQQPQRHHTTFHIHPRHIIRLDERHLDPCQQPQLPPRAQKQTRQNRAPPNHAITCSATYVQLDHWNEVRQERRDRYTGDALSV